MSIKKIALIIKSLSNIEFPRVVFVKLGGILLLIHRNCCKGWVVLNKTQRCGKMVVCKTHYQVCNMLYRFYLLQQHLTLLETEPAFSDLGHLILFIYRLKYIKVSFSKSSFELDLRSCNIFLLEDVTLS